MVNIRKSWLLFRDLLYVFIGVYSYPVYFYQLELCNYNALVVRIEAVYF